MIVPMKKAKIVVLKNDKERLLKSLQRYGELMITPTAEHANLNDTTTEDAFIQRTEKSLKVLKKYREKQGFFGDYKVIDYDNFIMIDPNRELILKSIEEINEEIDQINSDNTSLKDEINDLLPWSDLDIKLSDISTPKYAFIQTGFIEPKNIDYITSIINDYGGEIKLLGRSSDGQALVFACYIEDKRVLLERIKNSGFVEVSLDKKDKFVSEVIDDLKDKITRNLNRKTECELKLSELAKDVNELELMSDQMATISALKRTPLQHTDQTVYIEGWVRSDRLERLEQAIKEATDIYDLDISDPEIDEIVPTATKNNKFVSSFEMITNMFARPKHYEIDPNPIMSVWFWMIFGMMMGDAGYGIVMAILFYGIIKLKRPQGNSLKFMRLLFYSSFTTILWGVLFGTYFGAVWNPILLDPMGDIMKFLVISLIVGAGHVITGILIRAYDNIRHKKYFSALFDQFSWVMLLIGIGLIFIPQLKLVGMSLAITGALIVLLTAGRKSKSIFGKLFGGVFGLYNVTGYASDILSYLRILALSLSTAVIGMVMNLLAGLLQGNAIGFVFSILVYIVGHLFNIAIGLLSAYVHDSRLQYIEFFNKFYEGGGYDFEPLSLKLKYINEVNEKVQI